MALNIASPQKSGVVGLIRVYDDAGNVIETHEHAGDSKSGYAA